MPIVIEAVSAPLRTKLDPLTSLVEHLIDKGYQGLLSAAKKNYVKAVAGDDFRFTLEQTVDPERHSYRQARYYIRDEERYPWLGEIFLSRSDPGLLYIQVFIQVTRRRDTEPVIEVGYLGQSAHSGELQELVEAVTELLKRFTEEPVWSKVEPSSPAFTSLSESSETKFIRGSDVPEAELALAASLENSHTRDLAVLIRRAGTILAADLYRKGGIPSEEVKQIVSDLTAAGLVNQEYAIICKRTLNQVNRVDDRSKIDQLGRLGILCSCGTPLYEEKIEELFVPTANLKRMLDQSYWMTAKLVSSLVALGVPADNILLNCQEGAEEIDAFVDVAGRLLMFELKDSEFSMGHAYPYSGRIGLYKPHYAVIVSSRGVAPEVKDYFKRVKPDAKLEYICGIDSVGNELNRIISVLQSDAASRLLLQFEALAEVNISVARLVHHRLKAERELREGRAQMVSTA